MFIHIKQVFIVSLSFSESLATKCVYLNDEPSMVILTLIYLNDVEHNYYPFIISLDKYDRSCNALSTKICVPKANKRHNVKVFNMIINKNEA